MRITLTGKRIAVLGGDDRELVLIPQLVALGAQVKVVGFAQHQISKPGIWVDTPEMAVEDVDAVILPMAGTDPTGSIKATYSENKLLFDAELAKKLTGIPVFIGVAKACVQELCTEYQVPLIQIAEIDQIAILNSIPTSEGAIQVAMEETPFTIHGSHCFVLGFGRVAETLARNLKCLGAKVYGVARREADLARIYELGFEPVSFEELDGRIGCAQLIFNTVPSMVLGSERLELLNKDCVIIDLASAPGGTDFRSAEGLGLKAILALGLPGKVAPVTAGKILGEVLPGLIVKHTA